MIVQFIEKEGKREWAVVPYGLYQRLLEESELYQDIQAYDTAKEAVAEGEELIPSEITYAILDGANPLRVWREYRGLTQEQLSSQAGISKAYLSQLESGKRKGSTEVLSSLAKSLGLSLDDVVSLDSVPQNLPK